MTVSSPVKPAPTPWGLVFMLGALTAFAPLAIDMYLPALPTIQNVMGASPAQGQATLATFLAGMSIGQFIYGPASDRFGRRIPVLVGVSIFVAASAVCALATNIEGLTAARFVQALGGCAGGVVSRAVIRDRFDQTETARMLSLLMLVMGLAPIFAPLLGAAVLVFSGWRAVFWIITAFAVVTGVTAYFRLEESRSEATAAQARAESPIRAFAALAGSPRLTGYVLAGALNGAVLFSYISTSPGLLMGTYGFSPGVYPWLFGLNAIAVIGASQVNRHLLTRTTTDAVLARASLASVGLGLLLLIAAISGIGGMWTVLPLLFATLASYGLMQGNTMAGALSVDPRRAGSISALMGGASFATGAIASWLGGVLHDGTAKPVAVVMFVCLIGSAVALFGLALPRRPTSLIGP